MPNKRTNWPKITKRTYPSGKISWVVDCGKVNGKRRRVAFRTREEAEAFAAKLRTANEQEGVAAFTLSVADRVDAVRCLELLKPYGGNLVKAVEYYIEHHLKRLVSPTIAEMTAQILNEKRRANRRSSTIRALASFCRLMTNRFGDRQLHTLTLQELESICLGDNIQPRTQYNRIRFAKQLYLYARPRGWVVENLATAITVPNWEPAEPGCLSVEAIRNLLRLAPKYGLLGYVAIGLFGGVRRAELERSDWTDVHLADREIVIGARAAKLRSRRVIPCNDTLAAWLELCAKPSGPIVGEGKFESRFAALRKEAGITDWPHNALRHSFASYHLAHYKDPVRTAYVMGHRAGTEMLDTHYKSLVSSADAAAFWALRPEPPTC